MRQKRHRSAGFLKAPIEISTLTSLVFHYLSQIQRNVGVTITPLLASVKNDITKSIKRMK